jgi:hypothetical protein
MISLTFNFIPTFARKDEQCEEMEVRKYMTWEMKIRNFLLRKYKDKDNGKHREGRGKKRSCTIGWKGYEMLCWYSLLAFMECKMEYEK